MSKHCECVGLRAVCMGSNEIWVGSPNTVDLDRELCPPTGIPNIATDVCVCDEGYVRTNGPCVVAEETCTPMQYRGTNEQWSAQHNRCICDDSYALDLNGQCVVAFMCYSVMFDGVEYVCP